MHSFSFTYPAADGCGSSITLFAAYNVTSAIAFRTLRVAGDALGIAKCDSLVATLLRRVNNG